MAPTFQGLPNAVTNPNKHKPTRGSIHEVWCKKQGEPIDDVNDIVDKNFENYA